MFHLFVICPSACYMGFNHFCMSDLFALCPSLYSIICLLFVGLTKFVSISPVYLSVPVQFMCLVNLIFWAFSNDSIVVCICSYHYFLIVSITAFQWQKTHIKYTHLSIMVKAAIWSAVYIYPNAAHLSLSLWGFMKLYIFDFFQWLFLGTTGTNCVFSGAISHPF